MNQNSLNNQGFSLVEILVFMALAGIALLVSSQMFVNQMRQQRTVEVSSNFDQIRAGVQAAARNPDSIHFSALEFPDPNNLDPTNAELRACIESQGLNDQNLDCSPHPHHVAGLRPLRLLNRDGREVGGFYRLDGKKCTAQAADCPFKVTTQFKPICPASNALTVNGACARAQGIQIAWSIEQVTPVPNLKFFKKIEASLETVSSPLYAIPVPVQSILGSAATVQPCPAVSLTQTMLVSGGGTIDNKYSGLVGTVVPQTVTSFDAYGMPVCGLDMGALDAALLKRELCRAQIQAAWAGSLNPANEVQETIPVCDVKIVKNFLLNVPARYSRQCRSVPNFSHYTHSGTGVTIGTGTGANANLINQPGGIVSHLNDSAYTAAEINQMITDYGLPPSMNGLVQCVQMNQQSVAFDSSGALTVPPGIVSNTFFYKIVGGGGGGSGGGVGNFLNSKAGQGGGKGQFQQDTINVPEGQCTIIIGAGGMGSMSGSGQPGGTSTILCAGGVSIAVGGGTGGSFGAGSSQACSAVGASGGAGIDSDWPGSNDGGSGGAVDVNGGNATGYGAGGGGAGCKDNAVPSGGNGRNGRVEVRMLVATPFSPAQAGP